MVHDTILYDRLEINPDATFDEIKKKGRSLMIKWHPDKNPNNVDEATKKCQEINEALEILLDNDKRQQYDQQGMNFVKGAAPQGFPGGFPGGFPFGDMFGGFGHQQQHQQRENVTVELKVSLEKLYKEETVELKYNHHIFCGKCNGEGSKSGNKTTCKDCDGKGVRIQVIRMGPMIQQSMVSCNSCKSTGKVINQNDKCELCNGTCTVNVERNLSIPLKNGFTEGIKLQLEGKGHQYKDTKTDLIIVISIQQHDKFKRSGLDLLVELDLKLYEALFGFNREFKHLDDKLLHLQCSGITNPGTIRKIAGYGMTDLRSGNKGDLIIKFNLCLPHVKNEILIKAIRLLDKKDSENEVNIINNSNLIKTVMINVGTYNETQNTSEDSEETQRQEAPQCVQQ
jgi:DnaJ-class molecular chaperone